MSNPSESFKINLNQNLWGLAICMAALGFGERYDMGGLTTIAAILCCVMGLSVAITTAAYTYKYCKRKWD